MTGFEAKTILKNTAFLATVSTFQAIEDAVQTAIDALDKQERTGKWIENDNGTWSCDQCNSWIPDEQHHYARFCLYCGAKMEEKQ